MFADMQKLGEDIQRVVQSPLVMAIVALLTATGAIWAFYVKYRQSIQFRGVLLFAGIFVALAGAALLASRLVFPSKSPAEFVNPSPGEAAPGAGGAKVPSEDAVAAQVARWLALPLPPRPDEAALVIVQVENADPDQAGQVRDAIESQLTHAGRKLWRVGIKPDFVRDRMDAIWAGDIQSEVWTHRLVNVAPPDLFVLVKVSLSAPQKAAMDLHSVRGAVKLRCVSGTGQVWPIQECSDVHAQVTAEQAGMALLQGLTRQIEEMGLLAKALPR